MRFYHPGGKHQTPVKRKGTRTFIEIPVGYRGQGVPAEIDCPEDTLFVALGTDFHIVPPGGSCDIHLPAEVVKGMAPQLLTEEEYQTQQALAAAEAEKPVAKAKAKDDKPADDKAKA
jgi:hypothetical protein